MMVFPVLYMEAEKKLPKNHKKSHKNRKFPIHKREKKGECSAALWSLTSYL